MVNLFVSLLFSGPACFRTRAALQAEILALRHQLLVLQRSNSGHRLRLCATDRLLWVWLPRLWTDWRSALLIVKPETVIGERCWQPRKVSSHLLKQVAGPLFLYSFCLVLRFRLSTSAFAIRSTLDLSQTPYVGTGPKSNAPTIAKSCLRCPHPAVLNPALQCMPSNPNLVSSLRCGEWIIHLQYMCTILRLTRQENSERICGRSNSRAMSQPVMDRIVGAV